MKNNFKCIILLLTLILLFSLSYPCLAASELDFKLDDLTNQILANISENTDLDKTRIAVVEFPDLQNNSTELGKYIVEELTVRLFKTKKFEVIERQLLDKVLEELKLDLSGLVNPDSAKEIGKILGVSAIIAGTIADLGQNVKINSRLISAETGSIFAVASVEVKKDDTIAKLLTKIGAAPQVTPQPPPVATSAENKKKFTRSVNELEYIINLQKAQKYTEAIKKCNEAINMNFNDYWLHRELVLLNNQLGHMEEIKAFYQDKTFYDKTEPMNFIILGFIGILEEKYDVALNNLTKANNLGINIPPVKAWADDLTGTCYQQKGLYDQAVAAYSEALVLDPSLESSYRSLINIYLNVKKDYQKTISLCQVAILNVNNFAFAYAMMGYCYLKIVPKNTGEALISLNKAIALNESPDEEGLTYFALGSAYQTNGDINNAKLYLEKAIDKYRLVKTLSKDANWYNSCTSLLETVYRTLIKTYLIDKKDYGQAISLCQSAIINIDNFAYGYAVLGNCLMMSQPRDVDHAIRYLTKAIAITEFPDDEGWTYYFLGWAYQENGDINKSRLYLEKAIIQCRNVYASPGTVAWYNSCTSLLKDIYQNFIALYLSSKNYRQALSLCEEAVQKLDSFSYAYAVAGACYLYIRPKNINKAISLLTKATSIAEYPDKDGWTYYILGLAYKESKQNSKAQAAVEKAVKRCQEVNSAPERNISWYRASLKLLKELSKQNVRTFSFETREYIQEQYNINENVPEAQLRFGKEIPFNGYFGPLVGFGFSQHLLFTKLGFEGAWEMKSTQGGFSWTIPYGVGYYQALKNYEVTVKNFEVYNYNNDSSDIYWDYNAGLYYTIGVGLKYYFNQGKGLRLEVGANLEILPNEPDSFTLRGSIGLPLKDKN